MNILLHIRTSTRTTTRTTTIRTTKQQQPQQQEQVQQQQLKQQQEHEQQEQQQQRQKLTENKFNVVCCESMFRYNLQLQHCRLSKGRTKNSFNPRLKAQCCKKRTQPDPAVNVDPYRVPPNPDPGI
jgi:hypothetical protein